MIMIYFDNMKKRFPFLLIVLDGWGHNDNPKHNAIHGAKTPTFDSLWATFPHATLEASAEPIGLPKSQIGNSEIGHMTIGAGRIINPSLVRINRAAHANEFISNPSFTELFNHVNSHESTLHIMGLISPGGIHSHRDHLYEFLKAAKFSKIQNVAIHAFTDGRDVPPQSAASYLKELEDVLDEIGIGIIATVSGRFYAMDRDKNWHRIEKAERAIMESFGTTFESQKPSAVLDGLYKKGVIDELLEPLVFLGEDKKSWAVQKNDGIFFLNYRPDRMRQLASRMQTRTKPHNICMVTMTEYSKALESLVAFPDEKINDSLTSVISQAGLKQSHIAETEKYAHVTYFFNGGHEQPFKNEEHILIESRKDIKTHDQAPEMRAKEIADKVVEQIRAGDDFILVNFANADMVGHTANVPAINIAVETVDRELNKIVFAVQAAGGTMIITSDHGNAELNVDPETGAKHTAHTLHPVPFVITDQQLLIREKGTLADIAPTILELLHLQKPKSMTGKSLLTVRRKS